MTRPVPTDAEIAVLEALVAQRESLDARAGPEGPAFRTTLRFVDPQRQFIVVALAEGAQVPAHSPLAVEGTWGEWRVAFSAGSPVPMLHEGTAALRLDFPASVAVSRRRLQERAPIPEHAPLKCVAYSGASAVLEATIFDVSRGGFGMQVDFGGDSLYPGMVLGGCRVERDGGKPIAFDLEVRHTARAALPDGSSVVRVGCRFMNPSAEAMRLVEKYVAEKSD